MENKIKTLKFKNLRFLEFKNFRILSFLFVCIISVLLFSSCNNNPLDGMKMKLEVILNGNIINNSGYYHINLDNDTLSDTDAVVFKAHLYNSDNEEQLSAVFVFECDNLEFDTMLNNEASISVRKLKTLGEHKFKVKSVISDNISQTFRVETTTSLERFNLKYSLNNNFEKISAELTEEMKQGVVSEFNNSLNLGAGAVYTFNAIKVDENDKGNLGGGITITTSNNTVAYVRNVNGVSFELVCVGADRSYCNVYVSLGNSSLMRIFKITLSDITSLDVKDYELPDTESERVLTMSSLDRQKNYIINLSTFRTDDTLLFSLDAELIDQNKYFDGSVKEYVPSDNPNAKWYEASSLTFDTWYEGDPQLPSSKHTGAKWSILFNGVSKLFSITPKNDTVFSFNGLEQKNLHTYVYVKFKDDTTWRFKYRIMVGGIMEGIYLTNGNLVSDDKYEGDLIPNKSIDVKDVSLWTIKANYIPITVQENETWVYMARIKDWVDCYDNSGNLVNRIPKPITLDDKKIGAIAYIHASDRMTAEKFTGYYNKYGNKINLYKCYGCEKNDEIGRQSFDVRWGVANEEIRLVAINLDTLCYDYVDFKTTSTDTAAFTSIVQGHTDITNKSYYRLDTPKRNITVWDGDVKSTTRNTTTIPQTPYATVPDENECYMQSYPKTISEDNGNYRKFYQHVNSTSYFTLDANYQLKDVNVSLTSEARKYLSSALVSIDPITKRRADIIIESKYRTMLMSADVDEIDPLSSRVNDYITDKEGAYIDLAITNMDNITKYAKVQIVIYK